MKDLNKQKEILELRAMGFSFARIAKETGVSKQTAVDICKANEEKIATLNAVEIESLYEQHRITLFERLKAHANLLSRIREEIEQRDLSEITTDKLIDLYLKTSSSLKSELLEPTFQSSEEQAARKSEREMFAAIRPFG